MKVYKCDTVRQITLKKQMKKKNHIFDNTATKEQSLVRVRELQPMVLDQIIP